jgi:hypothetical protein
MGNNGQQLIALLPPRAGSINVRVVGTNQNNNSVEWNGVAGNLPNIARGVRYNAESKLMAIIGKARFKSSTTTALEVCAVGPLLFRKLSRGTITI